MKTARFLQFLTAFGIFCLPRLSAAPGDEHWAWTFGPPGPSNNVFALAVRGDEVYASGVLAAGPVLYTNWIEHWNGSRWSALPGTFTGDIPIFNSLFVGNDFYVCGAFSQIDGLPVGGIARWNGASWSGFGNIQGVGVSLATDGQNLYLGGAFTNIGGVGATNIAKWNGTSWSSLGDGLGDGRSSLSSYITALHWKDGTLYAGGSFTNSGGQSVRNLARWNGATWSEIGGTTDGPVYAIASTPTDLYVGGNFGMAGSTVARGVARWNGLNWSALGSGVMPPAPLSFFSTPVHAIGIFGTNVIVGGTFTNAGGIPAFRIARWDGLTWHSMGHMNGRVFNIQVVGTNAYIGGEFTQADNYIVNHLARWDGTRFHALGRKGYSEGAVFNVRALAAGNNRIYAGGSFSGIGDIQANRIAFWDGAKWSPLGSGVRGTNDGTGSSINAIAVAANGDVYAGGSFTNAGGVSARNVARWDGNNWFPLGAGIPGPVNAVAVRGNEVFVGGDFTLSTPTGTAFAVARWDGTAWSPLPGCCMAGTIGNFFVSALAIDGNDVYVGGSFQLSILGGGGGTSHNLAKNDGTGWVSVGGGVNNRVTSFLIDGQNVYAGGRFTMAGNTTVSRIAKWDGFNWSNLGGGVRGSGTTFSVNAMAKIDSTLYVAGSFTNAGQLPFNQIARWTGDMWLDMGSGLTRSLTIAGPLALAASGSDLFVGGNFEYAGGKPAFYIARWNETIDFDFVPSLRLSKPTSLPGGSFRFSISADGVPSYIIEASGNLRDWTAINTNTSPSTPITDPQATSLPHRFYRARSGPP